MSVCEWCWGRAIEAARESGESVTHEYCRILNEQNKKGKDAECPEARDVAIQKNEAAR